MTWGISTAPGCLPWSNRIPSDLTVISWLCSVSSDIWQSEQLVLDKEFLSCRHPLSAKCGIWCHVLLFSQTDAPSKPVERPYKRLSAQQVCYQRMQMAQQQAAQLSAATKAVQSSHGSSPSFSGERKRIAHRPNPQITSSKTRMSVSTDLEFSQVLYVFKVHEWVRLIMWYVDVITWSRSVR